MSTSYVVTVSICTTYIYISYIYVNNKSLILRRRWHHVESYNNVVTCNVTAPKKPSKQKFHMPLLFLAVRGFFCLRLGFCLMIPGIIIEEQAFPIIVGFRPATYCGCFGLPWLLPEWDECVHFMIHFTFHFSNLIKSIFLFVCSLTSSLISPSTS